MRVVISGTARTDLQNIQRWIARDNPKRALSFVRELREQIRGLARWPNRFPAKEEVDPSIRRLSYRGYRIFYRVSDSSVEVIEVHHGSRDTPDFR